MVYKIAHLFRDRLPALWQLIEIINSFIFSIRYGRRLRQIKPIVSKESYRIIPISEIPAEILVDFFARQPLEAYTFFKPHGFDTKSIQRLQGNKAFLAYVLMDDMAKRIAGYCFIRAFFHGRGFRGRIVDIDYRGRGLGAHMNRVLNDIGFGIGLRLFETVNKNNQASFRSSVSSSDIRILDELEGGDLLLEILPFSNR